MKSMAEECIGVESIEKHWRLIQSNIRQNLLHFDRVILLFLLFQKSHDRFLCESSVWVFSLCNTISLSSRIIFILPFLDISYGTMIEECIQKRLGIILINILEFLLLYSYVNMTNFSKRKNDYLNHSLQCYCCVHRLVDWLALCISKWSFLSEELRERKKNECKCVLSTFFCSFFFLLLSH